MSGIVAVLAGGGACVEPALVARLTAAMRGRGADAEQRWSDGPVGLGHTLLATTDADVAQPISLDRQVWITADARIDGQGTLRATLRAAGRPVAPDAPDAVLILAAYAVWGTTCAAHLLGDYAFVLWDAPRARLVAARSGFGVKPLYWARVPGALLVGNTIPALLAHPACRETLDESWLASFLVTGYGVDPAATVFEAIRRVPSGHTLVADPALAVTVHPHWCFPEPATVHARQPGAVVEAFRDVLGAAVRDRLRGRDAAVFLSGGLDSPTLAAVARAEQRETGGSLYAYTSVLEQLAPDDEGAYAGLVARALDIPHERFAADAHVLLDERVADAPPTPEPVDDPLLSVFREMAGAASQRARVALYGEDGDALFRPPGLRTILRTMPWGPLARDAARYRLQSGRMPHVGVDLIGGIRRRLARRPSNGSSDGGASSGAELPTWLRPEAADALRRAVDASSAGGEGSRDDESSRTRALRPEMYGMLTSPLWPPFLESVDPGFTNLPLEVRFPLLDARVIAFVAGIPPIPWCQHKALLRASMRGCLPEPVLQRGKAPVHHDVRGARLRQLAARAGTLPPLVAPLDALVDARALPRFDGSSDPALAWQSLRVHIVNDWLRLQLPRLYPSALPTTFPEESHRDVEHWERRRTPRRDSTKEAIPDAAPDGARQPA